MTTNTQDDDFTIHANHDRHIPLDGEPQCPSTLTIHERQKLIEGPDPTGNPPYWRNIWVDRTTPKTFKPRAPIK
jgi:hypothetical protein